MGACMHMEGGGVPLFPGQLHGVGGDACGFLGGRKWFRRGQQVAASGGEHWLSAGSCTDAWHRSDKAIVSRRLVWKGHTLPPPSSPHWCRIGKLVPLVVVAGVNYRSGILGIPAPLPLPQTPTYLYRLGKFVRLNDGTHGQRSDWQLESG